MTSPPNRPRGSARVPGPDPDGTGNSRDHGEPSGRFSSGRYDSDQRGSDQRGAGYGTPRGSHSAPDPDRGSGRRRDPGGPVGGETTGRHGAGNYGSGGRSGRRSADSAPSFSDYAPQPGERGSAFGDYAPPRAGDDERSASHRRSDYGSRSESPRSESTGRTRRSEYSDLGGASRYGDDESATGRHSSGASGPTGRASVGRGAAAVGGAAAAGSVGQASVGSASVGSASVGSARVGRASVGSASVRPSGPDDPTRPGGPLGPPLSRAEERRRALAGGSTSKVLKKRKRRRRIVAGIAALLLVVGLGTIGGAYYFTSVPLPDEQTPPQVSSIYYSDGSLMARLGTENRTHVDINKIPEQVKYAVVAAEDRSFYTNSGVDFKGIVRAAWGHVTGNADSGGASTITMQYAKQALDPSQTNRTYTEKLKEAVVAMKLGQKYSKDQILGFYLDTVYFGRGAYGIQAASQAYYHKDVTKLTAEQAAVIASVIKDPTNFDPAVDKQGAQTRWNYVLDGMTKLGKYHQPIDAAKYPMPIKPDPNSGASYGLDKPTGLVVTQIKQELVDNGKFSSMKEADERLRTGGYKITTTINRKAQDHAVYVANHELKGEQPGLADSIVAVEPGSGAVRAYYGGNDGTGYDTASHTHQPGSSFKVYVLAAALMNGYSIKSYWNGDGAEKLPARGADGKVHNSEDEICNDGGKGPDGHVRCSLTMAVRKSLNTVFYKLTYDLGKAAVLKIAAEAGIRQIVPTAANGSTEDPIDLTKVSPEKAADTPGIGYEVGFGQNPVTPLDHANGLATFANGGVYTTAHFIQKMTDADGNSGWSPKIEHRRVFSAAAAADIDYVLKGVANHESQMIEPHREQANKTGTWQYHDSNWQNSHAWTVGYIPQLACAVWVGNLKGDKPIQNNRGMAMYGWDLPGRIWAKFMTKAVQDLHFEAKSFPPAQFIGDKTKGQYSGVAPPPTHSASPTPTGTGTPTPGPTGTTPPGWPPTGQPTGPVTGTPTCPPWQNCPPAGGGRGGG